MKPYFFKSTLEERKLQPKQQQLILLASEGFVYIFEDDVKADPCPNPLEVIELEEEEKNLIFTIPLKYCWVLTVTLL